LEKVTGTCGHEILISGSSSNVNTDMGSCSWNSFSANSDSILKGGGVYINYNKLEKIDFAGKAQYHGLGGSTY
jgi:hypothetical protein